MFRTRLLVLGLLPSLAPAQPDVTAPPDAAIAAARAAETARVAVMARVAPAVCSVMQIGQAGGGSGVVFDPLGFVLTNFHCVGKPEVKKMQLGLPDGELYEATVLGIDPGSDLAVLLLHGKREGQTFPHAPLGDSDALLVGEQVFAMGNPFLLATDFQPTTTAGIVSGTHRYQPGGGNRMLVYPDCIQVDAPVNPGNSGGPLFNLQGEIVGINGRISVGDRGRVNVGVGFAIASNQIAHFLPDLMAGKHAEHGTLDMNAWFMQAPGEKGRHGVFVQSVFEDSVVTKAGVKLGDEITRFNGVQVRSANQLATLVGVLPAGAEVTLGFRPQLEGRGRDDRPGYGEERVVRVVLSRLDTGSSRDPDRLASDEHRALAAQTILRGVEGGEDLGGATVTLRFDAATVTLHRVGEQLAEVIGDARTVLESRDPPSGFVSGGGVTTDLDLEGATRLARLLRCNAWLYQGDARARLLAGALLDGGRLCGGRPAFGLRLPGEGVLRAWFFADGSPAGYGFRDPVAKAYVEVFVSEPGRVREYRDGVFTHDAPLGVAPPDTASAALLRRRP